MASQEREAAFVFRIAPMFDIPLKRKRNLDIEGPEPKAGPPTAREAELPLTRQQRRWKERHSK